MTKDPPPGTGPFGITTSEPNREFVLERNPRFESLGIDGVPPAKLDRITVQIIADKPKQAEDVLDGKLDYMSDSPPPDLLPDGPRSRRATATRSTRSPAAPTGSS